MEETKEEPPEYLEQQEDPEQQEHREDPEHQEHPEDEKEKDSTMPAINPPTNPQPVAPTKTK